MDKKFPNQDSQGIKDYRIPMKLEEFEQIGIEESEPSLEFYLRFYGNNERVNSASSKEIRENATKGLKLLIWSSIFDGEVCNGGIAQFFWNCPDFVADVCEVFDEFDLCELHEIYEVACNSVMENMDGWMRLRDAAYLDESNPDWASYKAACELLDLRWFDEKYWDKTTWNEHEGSRLVSAGLRTDLLAKLSEFIKANPTEFIVST